MKINHPPKNPGDKRTLAVGVLYFLFCFLNRGFTFPIRY